MAEGTLPDKTEASALGKHNHLRQLFDAIHCKDKAKCKELLSEISVRQVNHLVRLKYEGYVGYTVTPLLFAVITGCHDIVELLLSYHANVDKIGTYKTYGTLYSYSPLLKAVQNSDIKTVKILSEKRAQVQSGVPGERVDEEEGGTLQYREYLFPLNICLGKETEMFKILLSYADIELEYGPGKHTCLCYALEYFLESENMSNLSNLSYIKEVLNNGGRFCRGVLEYASSPDRRMCCHLRKFRQIVLIYRGADEEKQLATLMNCFHCLQLLSRSDYLHRQSQIYSVFRQCSELMRQTQEHFQFNHFHEVVKDVMSRINQYTKTPCSLQHISCVAIRRFIKPFNRQQCERLGLPTKLIRYIMLDDF